MENTIGTYSKEIFREKIQIQKYKNTDLTNVTPHYVVSEDDDDDTYYLLITSAS